MTGNHPFGSEQNRMKTVPDIRKVFAAHLKAAQKQVEWAQKGLALVKAGKMEEARKALRKAEYWEFQQRKLER